MAIPIHVVEKIYSDTNSNQVFFTHTVLHCNEYLLALSPGFPSSQ